MKAGMKEIIGKTISGVVVGTQKDRIRQIFLVFTDNTYLELFGEHYAWRNELDSGGTAEAVRYAKGSGADRIHVIPREPGSN